MRPPVHPILLQVPPLELPDCVEQCNVTTSGPAWLSSSSWTSDDGCLRECNDVAAEDMDNGIQASLITAARLTRHEPRIAPYTLLCVIHSRNMRPFAAFIVNLT